MSNNRKEKAMEFFGQGYNCSQSVVLAFKDVVPIDEDVLMRLSSSFGGGVGRLREVCGCVSGMCIVSGAMYGFNEPKSDTDKAEHYARIQQLAKEFENKCGSIVCRDLLELSVKHDEPIPEKRTSQYYQKRPCKELVGIAVEILEDYIKNADDEK